jgi:hypothetical protein
MPDPIISRSVVSGVTPKTTGLEGPAKPGQSFEQVRQQVSQQPPPEKIPMPPAAPEPSAEVRKAATADLHKKLKGATTPDQVFGPDLNKLDGNMNRLRKSVEQVPKTANFEPLWTRLEHLEKQFSDTGLKAKQLASLDDPRAMLELQLQVYQVTQNFEIVSKVVEQVNSGVKQIVQTQV